jgi:hypothetical protein
MVGKEAVMAAEKASGVPSGLKAGGRRLWKSVTDDYELDRHELDLLAQAARTVDTLDALEAIVASEGLMSMSAQGARVHPAVSESRQQKITLARLLAALRVPLGDQEGAENTTRRQPRRAPRGVYGIRGVAK